MIIPTLPLKPSISTNNWFNVCSRSSWPPPIPAPRWRPTASISSINIIQGAFSFAVLNISLTRDAPTPTNISTKSEPEIEKNGTPASPATAFASNVLPVPGGPNNKTPLGTLAPISLYFLGFFKKSIISTSSSFSSSHPATSLNVTFVLLILAVDLAKSNAPPAPPLFLIKNLINNINIIAVIIYGNNDNIILHQLKLDKDVILTVTLLLYGPVGSINVFKLSYVIIAVNDFWELSKLDVIVPVISYIK